MTGCITDHKYIIVMLQWPQIWSCFTNKNSGHASLATIWTFVITYSKLMDIKINVKRYENDVYTTDTSLLVCKYIYIHVEIHTYWNAL